MNFNNHSDYEGKHAFLGASTYSWIRYDIDKLTSRYRNEAAKERGTRLHALACEHIKLRIPCSDDGKLTTIPVFFMQLVARPGYWLPGPDLSCLANSL